jgi:predicted Rdx family selenoprotein
VTQTADQGATGNFEVKVNGTLVHSKATRGQGRCETGEETQRVVDAITDALE